MAMNVRQLINRLKTFPPDTLVLFQCCSSPSEMSPEDVTLMTAEERKIVRRPNGNYVYHSDHWLKPGDPPPEYVTAVHFPGN